jgi:hypothetical protein
MRPTRYKRRPMVEMHPGRVARRRALCRLTDKDCTRAATALAVYVMTMEPRVAHRAAALQMAGPSLVKIREAKDEYERIRDFVGSIRRVVETLSA